MRYNPDEGNTAIARRLDLPQNRVRPWLEGSEPDAVHAIDVATEHGWLAETWTPTVRALSQLIARIFATGSTTEQWFRPSWTPSEHVTRDQIQAGLDAIGVDLVTAHDERPHRTMELRPSEHLPILAQVLALRLGRKTSS